MSLLRASIAMTALVACTALPPVAAAETVVPPGNSAATQYTETFPTSNGEADLNQGINGGEVDPSKVLGAENARRLESAGAEGRQVAMIAAATAPPAPETESGGGHPASHGAGAGSGRGSGGSGGAPQNGSQERRNVRVDQPSGSSGLGQVLGQATGTDSGRLGLWLPLLIVATIAWALAYAWRQRRVAG